MADPDGELGDADPFQGLSHDGDHLGIGQRRRGTGDVGITLPELAEASTLWIFRAPDRGDLVALEGEDQIVLMHCHHAGQGYGQVVAQPDLTTTGVLEAVHQLFVFARLTGENVEILQRRRIEWLEAMALEDVAEDADDPLAQDHLLRQVVAEPLEDTRLPLLPSALAAHLPPILSGRDVATLTSGDASPPLATEQPAVLLCYLVDEVSELRDDELRQRQTNRVRRSRQSH